MARIYWRLATEAGWTYPEIDALLLDDLEEIVEQWREEGTVVDRVADPRPSSAPREVSEEEFQRIADAERGFAEKHGGPRSPFA